MGIYVLIDKKRTNFLLCVAYGGMMLIMDILLPIKELNVS